MFLHPSFYLFHKLLFPFTVVLLNQVCNNYKDRVLFQNQLIYKSWLQQALRWEDRRQPSKRIWSFEPSNSLEVYWICLYFHKYGLSYQLEKVFRFYFQDWALFLPSKYQFSFPSKHLLMSNKALRMNEKRFGYLLLENQDFSWYQEIKFQKCL